jgi:heme a synthase
MNLFNEPELRKPGFKLAFFACVLAVFVLGLGAFTRLADAGLGCPDWPTCYGHALWPETADEVRVANQAYPDMQVEHDKTWPEMVHRYFATALGFITILLVAFAWKNRRDALPLKLPVFLLGFIILQGLFGMWTVTLKLWPQVVTAHLLGGFTTLSLLWLLTLRLNSKHWEVDSSELPQVKKFKSMALIGLIIVVCQIALGGWTTSNYAAVACPDLPTCQSQWLPEMDFPQGFNISQSIGPNYLGGAMDNKARIAIHFSHRVGAIITTIYLILMGVLLLRGAAVFKTSPLVKIILGVLVLQVLLGLGNIYFQFPVFVAVSHNLVGALLLLTMVTLNYRIFTAQLRN